MSWAWTKLFVDLPVLGLEYEIKNSDCLVSSKPCVIVSNHQSSLDVIGMETFCYRPQTKFGTRKYFHRCLFVCPQGGGGLPDRDPPRTETSPGQKSPLYGKERVVRILLECIFVLHNSTLLSTNRLFNSV